MAGKKRYTIVASCYDARGRKISEATNSYTKTHPLQAHFAKLAGQPERVYLHAEILALIRAGQTPVHTLRVTNLTGKLSAPCRVCMAAINAYGVRRVIQG